MKIENVLIIGGSGFLGRHLAERLGAQSVFVTVPTRRPQRTRDILVLPTVEVVEADVHDPRTLAGLVDGRDVVINAVGVLRGGRGDPYGPGFAQTHVELPAKIARAASQAGVPRLLHVSALKADADAPSGYLRSKAAGEAAIRPAGSGVATTIFRPSVMFGAGDSFLNLFARLQKRFPLLPLACPDARFQPVWVEDVAAAMLESTARAESFGATYELCGPKVYRLRELVALAGRYGGISRPIVGLPDALSYFQAWAMEFVPGAPMTRDNYLSMQLPNVCQAGCTLPFGLVAASLESIAPHFLPEPRRALPFHLRDKLGR